MPRLRSPPAQRTSSEAVDRTAYSRRKRLVPSRRRRRSLTCTTSTVSYLLPSYQPYLPAAYYVHATAPRLPASPCCANSLLSPLRQTFAGRGLMDDRPYHNQSREAWSASGIAQDPHAAASAVRRSQQATNSAAREQAERALAARVASMIGQRPSQVPAGSAVAALRASGGGSLNRPPSPASSAGSMSMPPVAGASAPSIANPPPQMQGGLAASIVGRARQLGRPFHPQPE